MEMTHQNMQKYSVRDFNVILGYRCIICILEIHFGFVYTSKRKAESNYLVGGRLHMKLLDFFDSNTIFEIFLWMNVLWKSQIYES